MLLFTLAALLSYTTASPFQLLSISPYRLDFSGHQIQAAHFQGTKRSALPQNPSSASQGAQVFFVLPQNLDEAAAVRQIQANDEPTTVHPKINALIEKAEKLVADRARERTGKYNFDGRFEAEVEGSGEEVHEMTDSVVEVEGVKGIHDVEEAATNVEKVKPKHVKKLDTTEAPMAKKSAEKPDLEDVPEVVTSSLDAKEKEINEHTDDVQKDKKAKAVEARKEKLKALKKIMEGKEGGVDQSVEDVMMRIEMLRKILKMKKEASKAKGKPTNDSESKTSKTSKTTKTTKTLKTTKTTKKPSSKKSTQKPKTSKKTEGGPPGTVEARPPGAMPEEKESPIAVLKPNKKAINKPKKTAVTKAPMKAGVKPLLLVDSDLIEIGTKRTVDGGDSAPVSDEVPEETTTTSTTTDSTTTATTPIAETTTTTTTTTPTPMLHVRNAFPTEVVIEGRPFYLVPKQARARDYLEPYGGGGYMKKSTPEEWLDKLAVEQTQFRGDGFDGEQSQHTRIQSTDDGDQVVIEQVQDAAESGADQRTAEPAEQSENVGLRRAAVLA